MKKRLVYFFCSLVVLLVTGQQLHAATATIAVASNFLLPAKELSAQFEQQTGHHIKISGGSTGKLYAQITHGAPFDVFLAANESEPTRLEQQDQAVAGSRFTYALGQLALYSPGSQLKESAPTPQWTTVAIANPRTAPYGKAAMVVLKKYFGAKTPFRLVRGESVGQAYQYARSGTAQAGFVALSQLYADSGVNPEDYQKIPVDQYPPIRQQAVLLNRGATNEAARKFLAFIKSKQVAALLVEKYGYGMEQHELKTSMVTQ